MPKLPERALELLRGKTYGHVVTVNRDGSPQVTMVYLDEIEGDMAFATTRDRVKFRNLERDPRIIVSVQNVDRPGQYLLVHGRAVLEEDPSLAFTNSVNVKFTGQQYTPRDEAEQRVIVRVDADRLGGRGPWVA